MEIWRISNYADLSGIGGVRAAGRWHSQGRRIVYLADHPSSALLEMLVHMDRDLIPPTYQLLRIDIPPDMKIEAVTASDLGRKLADRHYDKPGNRGSVARSIKQRIAAGAICDQRAGTKLPFKSCSSRCGEGYLGGNLSRHLMLACSNEPIFSR